MPTVPLDTRISALQEKLRQAKAKKTRLESRKRALESKADRTRDTRRKILVGAAVLNSVARGEMPQEQLTAMLDTALTREDDRALFGLLPMAESLAAKIDARKIEEGIPF